MRSPLHLIFFFALPVLFLGNAFTADSVSKPTGGAIVQENIVNSKNSYKINLKSDKTPQSTIFAEPITFTISFSNNAVTARSFDVSTEWSLGSLNKNTENMFDIVTYVPGSASKITNQKSAVIDPENRRVTWHLENVPPGGKEENVSFQLIARDPVLVENARYSYHVSANISYSGGTISSNKLEVTAENKLPRTSKQSTINEEIPKLLFASLTEITDSSATFFFSYFKPTATNIRFESPSGHSGLLNDQRYLTQKTTTLKGLKPDTVYFVRFESTDIEWHTKDESEQWIFRTAKQDARDFCHPAQTIISAGDISIPLKGLESGTRLTLPRGTKIGISITHTGESPFSSTARLGPITKSGIPAWLNSSEIINLNRGMQNTYSGNYILTGINSDYGLFFDCRGQDGGIARHLAVVFHLSEPITITDSTGRPIVKARIDLERFEKSKKIFEKYPALTNGSFKITPKNGGRINVFLLEGLYRARISAPGFRSKTIEFSFNPATDKVYPVLALENKTMSLPYFARGVLENTKEMTRLIKDSFRQITLMENFYEQSAMVTFVFAIFLGFLGYSDYFTKTRYFDFLKKYRSRNSGVFKLLAGPALLFIAKNIVTLAIFSLFIFYFWLIVFTGPLKIRVITGLTVINLALTLNIIWKNWCTHYDKTKNRV